MKSKITTKPVKLLGLTKKEVFNRMGDHSNFYLNTQWIYETKKVWPWGEKEKLYIDFDRYDVVIA